MTDELVSPYTTLFMKMLWEELTTNAPIRELRAREVDAKKVDAVMVLAITVKYKPLSFPSTCNTLSTQAFL